MKKFLCFTAILFACLTGCSSRYDNEAMQLYLDATQNMKDVESLHLDIAGNIYGDSKKDMQIAKAGINADMIISEKPQLAMDLDFAFSGVALGDMNFYLKDNTFYMNIMGEKAKISFQEYLDQTGPIDDEDLGIGTAADKESIKQIFKEFKFKDKEAGIIAFSFDLDWLDKISGILGNDVQLKDVIKSYDGTMKIQDQTLTEMTFDLLVSAEGEEYPVNLTIAFSKQNEIKDIKFPDFKGYKDKEIHDELNVDLIGEDSDDL